MESQLDSDSQTESQPQIAQLNINSEPEPDWELEQVERKESKKLEARVLPKCSYKQLYDDQKLSRDDFNFIKTLGKGAYAKVYLIEHKVDKQKFACKIVDKDLIRRHNKEKTLQTEIEVFEKANFPGVIKLFFHFEDQSWAYLGLEYAENGELGDSIKKAGTLSLFAAQHYTAQLVHTLEHIHCNNILHRDLKPENILMDANWRIKLTDFGTARIADPEKEATQRSRANTFVGSAAYVSPEMLSSGEIGPAVDVWAMGCIIFVMLTGRPPFKGASEMLTFRMIQNRELVFPADLDPLAKDLINHLLMVDPTKRMMGHKPWEFYQKLKTHSFFDGIEWATLFTSPSPPIVFKQPPPTAQPQPAAPELKELTPSVRASGTTSESSENSKLKPQYTVYSKHLTDGEVVCFSGLVSKSNPKNPFMKKRTLLLIKGSSPSHNRIIYIDPTKNTFKGEVAVPGLRVESKDLRTFYLITPSRKFTIQSHTTSSTSWIIEIEKLLKLD